MNKKHIVTFQVLRGLALISVYVYHQGLKYEVTSRWGVSVFFVLSGFLSVLHHIDRQNGSLSLTGCVKSGTGRLKRIFPLHAVMLTLAFVMYAAGQISGLRSQMPGVILTGTVKYLLNLTLLSDWIPHIPATAAICGEYNIVTWFLSAMLLFYILTPPLMKLMRGMFAKDPVRRAAIALAAVYLVIAAENVILYKTLGITAAFWHVYESPLSRIGDYLAGALLGVIYLNSDHKTVIEGRPSVKVYPILIAAMMINAVFICAFLLPAFKEHVYLASSGFYFTLPAGLLIYLLACSDGIIGGVLKDSLPGRILVWLGNMSSYVYLIHYPVITGFHGVLKRLGEVNMAVWCLLSAGASLLTAYLYHRLITGKK